MEDFAKFKEAQKQSWMHFVQLEAMTTPTAACLVNFAGLSSGQEVLDVACGTGVVAITAARAGCRVSGLDLTPALLERARENARIAKVEVEWREGDAEMLPYDDSRFDVVLSQYGHMFAPRPEIVTAEMLRVLKPGGTIAFSTWPPEQLVGRSFTLMVNYLPPPAGLVPPSLWGDPDIIRERLGSAVKDIQFDRRIMWIPALSPQNYRDMLERNAGPLLKLVETLKDSEPAKLAEFRQRYEALIAEYFEDNRIRQEYLLTRATKL